MRYVVLAVLMFLLGGLVLSFEPEAAAFTPIVRVRSAEGLYITLVQPRTPKRNACNAAVDEFVKALDGACATCSIESTECTDRVVGIDKALADGAGMPIYTVASEGLRMGVVGPPEAVKTACEAMATQLVLHGSKVATCVAPTLRN